MGGRAQSTFYWFAFNECSIIRLNTVEINVWIKGPINNSWTDSDNGLAPNLCWTNSLTHVYWTRVRRVNDEIGEACIFSTTYLAQFTETTGSEERLGHIIPAKSIYSSFLWQQHTVWGSPGVGSRTNTCNYSDVKIKHKWQAIANSLLSLPITKKVKSNAGVKYMPHLLQFCTRFCKNEYTVTHGIMSAGDYVDNRVIHFLPETKCWYICGLRANEYFRK